MDKPEDSYYINDYLNTERNILIHITIYFVVINKNFLTYSFKNNILCCSNKY